MRHKGNRKMLVIAAAAFCLFATAAVSAAYWTDRIELGASVSTMDIGIKYDSDAVGLGNGSRFQPGESREFGFTVKNDGDISVDIKPVITIRTDKPMTGNGSLFKIVNSDGAEITGYDVEYFDAGGNTVDPAGGNAFTSVRYMLHDEITLAGEEQKDAGLGETSDTKNFNYQLKLAETTGNDFVNASAEMTVSTYAIQHRFRENGAQRWLEFPAAG